MNGLTLGAMAAAITFALGAGTGYKLTADHYQAVAAREQQEAAEAYQARTVELNQLSAELERARHDRKVVYRTITRNVETYINDPLYQRDCVDERGLRDINAALAGRASAGQPADAVPAAGAAAGNDRR